MHRSRGINKLVKRKALGLAIALCLIVFSTNVFTYAGGSNALTITVITEHLNTESEVTLTKVEDGIILEMTETTTLVGEKYTATFVQVPPGESCTITGSDVPGFTTPEPYIQDLSKLKGNFNINVTLDYTPQSIAVEGVQMNPETLELIVGESAELEAGILPSNASNQALDWAIDSVAQGSEPSSAVITFDESTGMVFAVAPGSATLTATSQENPDASASCTVTVSTIDSFALLPPIHAATGDIIVLPPSVSANLSNGEAQEVNVSWEDASTVDDTQIILFDIAGEYLLYGYTVVSSSAIELPITVTGEDTNSSPDSITLSDTMLSVYYGIDENTVPLSITSTIPENASLSALRWSLLNPDIAELIRVSDQEYDLRGKAPGTTYVVVQTWDGQELARCYISVALDPALTDPSYISATTEDSPVPVDQFDAQEDVWIRCYNLPAGEYFIKVEDKGHDNLLVEDAEPDEDGFTYPSITVPEHPPEGLFMYNLYETAEFRLTDKYSKSYFVSMSTDSTFPSGDDENSLPLTYADNFKIGSPIPTTPLPDIQILILDCPAEFIGKDVILAREIDKPVEETNYEDYLSVSGDPKYSDEVKLVGKIQEDGTVIWLPPKEKLKIGGYILLIEIPMSDPGDGSPPVPLYETNLNLVNPDSEDGALVKEVHVNRNEPIVRVIIVTPIN